MSWRSQISRHVQEFRMVCCESSESGKGLRTFFRKNYNELCTLNPYMPFVYREVNSSDAFLHARYDWGVERTIKVNDMTPEQLTETMKGLVEYGMTLPKSPESDIWLPQTVIEAGTPPDEIEGINITWDGKTIRQNPFIPNDDE